MHVVERVEAALVTAAEQIELQAVQLGGLRPRLAELLGDGVDRGGELVQLGPEQRRRQRDGAFRPPRELLVQRPDERLARHSGSPAVMRS